MKDTQAVPKWGKRPDKLCKDGKYRSYSIAQAHHDLPFSERAWFARHGLDVNNPAFGRWVSDAEHFSWHNEQVPDFNKVWEEFILDEGPTPFTVTQILDELAEVRQTFIVTGAN